MSRNNFIIPVEELSQALIKNSFWMSDSVFSKSFVEKLYGHVQQLNNSGRMQEANIGRSHELKRMENIRGDLISWVEQWDETAELKLFHEFLKELQSILSENLLVSLKQFEMHFAIYPIGTFYQKHLDQHRDSTHRQVTLVFYLSPWSPGNGGELKIYPRNQDPIAIAPLAGRMLCFLSGQLPHEVLTTHVPRYSLTGWFRDD